MLAIMKRISILIFFSLFLFSILQTKTAYGQNSNVDSLNISQESTDSVKHKKKTFSFFKRIFKRKSSNKIENDTINTVVAVINTKTDSSETGVKDSVDSKIKESIPADELKHVFQDKIGVDSLSDLADSDAMKDKAKNKLKDVVPDVNVKQELNGVKDGAKGILAEKKDTYLTKNVTKLKSFNGKEYLKKQKNAIKPTGSISVGYEYGVLPFVSGDNYPNGGFKTEGNISFLVLNVPLEFTYYYTDIKNVIGFNNYFRLSYDANRYKEQLAQKMGTKDQILKKELGALQSQQQKLAQKIEYLKFMESFPTYQIPATDSLKNKVSNKVNLPENNLNDLSGKLPAKPDSINFNSIKLDSLQSMKLDTSKIKDATNNPPNLPDTANYKSKYNKKSDGIKNKYADSSKIPSYSNKYKLVKDSVKMDSIFNSPNRKNNNSKDSTKHNGEDYFQSDSLKSKKADSTQTKKRKRLFGFKTRSERIKAREENKAKQDSIQNYNEMHTASDSLSSSSKRNRKSRFEKDTTQTKPQVMTHKDSIAECKADSAKSHDDYMRKKDSVSNQMHIYKEKYDSINNEINIIMKRIDQVKSIINNPTQVLNPYLSKFQTLLSHVKKFEIGLCHPSYSTFLVNNIPLQGVNMEYEKNDKFFAFTYGTTINNLLFNTNTLEGTLQSGRNLYNYFDFTNLESGRKVLSLKGGFGKKDESHLFVGALIGKGKSDYLLPVTDPLLIRKESNLVFEIDARYKFTEFLSADIVFGKSAIREGDLTGDQLGKAVNEIFSNYRSNAILFRVNSSIKKTKTKLTFLTRWIDPFFKSYGIGFLRSDNLRFEIKAEQPITSKIKYTIAYRREEDNLLKLYDYKNTLQSINNSVNVKFNRHFNLRLIYSPLFRELKSETVSIKDRNNISTVIFTFIPKTKRTSVQFNGLYSRYIISGDSASINFENIAYTHQFAFRSGFKTDLNVSWFKNNLSDTLGNDTYLSVLDVGYTAKNNTSFIIGGKMAYKNKMEPQYGFVVKATVKIYKGLFVNGEMEKIIIGDYYNSFIIEKIQKFPYYCSLRLMLNF